jgi:hypothetical protein
LDRTVPFVHPACFPERGYDDPMKSEHAPGALSLDLGPFEFGSSDAAPISPQTLRVDAAEEPSGIRVRWRVRRLYHGGAPPPAQIVAQARDEHAGAILIDPNTGRFRSVAASETVFGETESEPADLGPHAAPTPDTLAIGRAGDRLFALRRRSRPGGVAEITLEAREAGNDGTLWETPLAQIESARPPPLRQ